MPWNAKGKDLLIKQYASVGCAATLGLTQSIEALSRAQDVVPDDLVTRFINRKECIEKYITSYRSYCRDVHGMDGLVFAPFHLLATENKTYFDKQHSWHLENIKQICDCNKKHLMVTSNRIVDLQSQDDIQKAIDWWMDITEKGSEGMVVKPLDYITYYNKKIVQPALKCRGKEYLRIIYGPEYDLNQNLQKLKNRNLKMKRESAIREFVLGLESLDRFVNNEPLRRIHECVFGVLALESESIDPRL